MKCFNEKNEHVGHLIELDKFYAEINVEASVKWCKECGAIVIDRVTDGRIMGQYITMQFPNITRQKLSEK